MKGARFVCLAALVLAIGCAKNKDRTVSPPSNTDDAGDAASGGKSTGSGGRSAGGTAPALDASPDAEGSGGTAGSDASAGGAGNGGASGGTGGTGGVSGSGGQGGTPPKPPSTDPAAPVDLAPGDVVQGTIPAGGDHFWRIPAHIPGAYGLILRSTGNATVGFSDTPSGGATQPGVNGCLTGTKGSCGQRIDASFLTAGNPVTVFVFGPEGTTYELEVVPFTPLTGAPPTTGFAQTLVYGTQFMGTFATADGPVTKAAPTSETYLWQKTDGANTEWFTLPGGFTCAARPFAATGVMKANVTNLTLGTSSYPVNVNTVTLPTKPGAAFTSGATVPVSVTESGTTASSTATAPTFTEDATASFEDEELWMEWFGFDEADMAILSFIADMGPTDAQVTCRKDVSGITGTDRHVSVLNGAIKDQILARGMAIYYWHMAICSGMQLPPNVLASLFLTQQSELLLCQSVRLTAESIGTKL